MIYHDDEGALSSRKVQDLFEAEDVTHVLTKTHANQAERLMRTGKYRANLKSHDMMNNAFYKLEGFTKRQPARITFNPRLKSVCLDSY